MIEKTLVFHFYGMKDYKDKTSYKLHFLCLKKYAHIFTSSKFVISVDDTSDTELIENIETDIIKCGFSKNVSFEVIENDKYMECYTFKKYILDNLKNLNGIVFFAHTKGVFDIDFYTNEDNFYKWIYALYYFSLEWVSEVEGKLIGAFGGRRRTFYGSLLTYDGNKAYYPGTFYWINPKQVLNDIEEGTIKLPEISDRTFAENFPKMYYFKHSEKIDNGNKVDGHKTISVSKDKFDFYYTKDWGEVAASYGEEWGYKLSFNEIIKDL